MKDSLKVTGATLPKCIESWKCLEAYVLPRLNLTVTNWCMSVKA